MSFDQSENPEIKKYDIVVCELIYSIVCKNICIIDGMINSQLTDQFDTKTSEQLKNISKVLYSDTVMKIRNIIFEWGKLHVVDSGFSVDKSIFLKEDNLSVTLDSIKERLVELEDIVKEIKQDIDNNQDACNKIHFLLKNLW